MNNIILRVREFPRRVSYNMAIRGRTRDHGIYELDICSI